MVQPFRFPNLRRASAAACLVSLSQWAVTAHSQPAPAASAPSAAPASKPDPLDPLARVPVLRYESALRSGKAAGADKPVSWRDANDTVTRIGGWRVYLREAQLPEPVTAIPQTPASATPAAAAASSAAAPAAPPSPKPPPGSHHGHPQR